MWKDMGMLRGWPQEFVKGNRQPSEREYPTMFEIMRALTTDYSRRETVNSRAADFDTSAFDPAFDKPFFGL